MKFILEGIDGSGKSTLAKKIKETFSFMNFDIVHCTRETNNNMEFFCDMIYNLNHNYSDNLIIDRMHLGQAVYQTEEERLANGWMTDDEIIRLENMLSKRNEVEPIIRIFVDTPIDTCLYNCHHNGEDGHYTKEYLEDLRNRYLNLLERLKNVNAVNNWIIYKNNFVSPEVVRNFDYSSLPHIVLVDFDKTLNLTDKPFPSIGEPNTRLIKDLTEGRWKDSKKILFTSRTDDSLKEAIDCCREWGIEFDAVNDNIKEVKDAGLSPRKIFGHLIIDDLALNPNDMYKD